MQRTVRLKFTGPTEALIEPMRAFAAACDHLANDVNSGDCRPNFLALNAKHYHALRDRHGLMSQAAQTAERHVAGTFATLRANGHGERIVRFRKPFAKLLHSKDWRFRDDKLVLSLNGARLAFDVTARSEDVGKLLCGKPGGATLIKRGLNYFLNVCIKLPDVSVHAPLVPIGIDRGIKTLAVARAPGKTPLVIRGGRMRDYRRRMAETRQRLQAKGTRSAKRVLRRLRTREQRFVLDQARVAAKAIVAYAEKTPGSVLVLEQLDGIRDSARTRGKNARRDLNSWAFRLLHTCLASKAEERGHPTALVDPAYTSRTCPACGDARKTNRAGLSYECLNCGYRNHADVVGATNVGRVWQSGTLALPRGQVKGPNGWNVEGLLAVHETPEFTSKPPTSVGGI